MLAVQAQPQTVHKAISDDIGYAGVYKDSMPPKSQLQIVTNKMVVDTNFGKMLSMLSILLSRFSNKSDAIKECEMTDFSKAPGEKRKMEVTCSMTFFFGLFSIYWKEVAFSVR